VQTSSMLAKGCPLALWHMHCLHYIISGSIMHPIVTWHSQVKVRNGCTVQFVLPS